MIINTVCTSDGGNVEEYEADQRNYGGEDGVQSDAVYLSKCINVICLTITC